MYKTWGFATELALIIGDVARKIRFYFSISPSTLFFLLSLHITLTVSRHVVANVALQAFPSV